MQASQETRKVITLYHTSLSRCIRRGQCHPRQEADGEGRDPGDTRTYGQLLVVSQLVEQEGVSEPVAEAAADVQGPKTKGRGVYSYTPGGPLML